MADRSHGTLFDFNQLTLRLSFPFYNMLQSLLAITAVLFLITSSNALSIDTSHHLARHQHIARHPVVKRASGASDSARCIKRDSTSVAVPSSTSTANLASSSSQAPPSSGSGKVGIAWAFDSDGLAIKNFLTSKVSTFVDFFLFSFFPHLFSPAYTLGPLLNYKIFMDCNFVQCYGATTKSLSFRTLSRAITQIVL